MVAWEAGCATEAVQKQRTFPGLTAPNPHAMPRALGGFGVYTQYILDGVTLLILLVTDCRLEAE